MPRYRDSVWRTLYENRWVTNETNFVDMSRYDNDVVNPNLERVIKDPSLPVFVAVDASTKHDQTALVAVHINQAAQQVRLVNHRCYQPSPDDPLDFEQTIERTLLEWRERFCVVKVLFDPPWLKAEANVTQKAITTGKVLASIRSRSTSSKCRSGATSKVTRSTATAAPPSVQHCQ